MNEVVEIRRYPVKSMLGEAPDALALTASGVAGDRAWAVLDMATGKVASAKHAKLWRGLLACTVRTHGEEVGIAGPGDVHDPELHGVAPVLERQEDLQALGEGADRDVVDDGALHGAPREAGRGQV